MWLLHPIMPWRVASRLFGGYLPRKLLFFDAVPGKASLPDAVSSLGSPALEKLYPLRWLFSLGTLLLLAPLVSADLGGVFQTAINICSTTMLVGAPSTLVILLVVRQVAQPAARAEATRALGPAFRVSGIALLTMIVAIGDYLPFWPDAISLNGISHAIGASGSVLLMIVLIPAFLWLLVFVLCASYLVHNNSFRVPAGTLTDAVVNLWLAWSVAAANLVLMSIAGIRYDGWTVVLAIAGALIASGISAWELVVLRRSGARFRTGPWAAPQPAAGGSGAGTP